MTRGVGPVPEEVLTRHLGATDGEAVSFFLRQLRLRALDTLAGRVAGAATTTGGGTTSPSPSPTPGPPGPPGPPATYTPDLTPPPTPSGVVVSAGLDFIFFATDAPTFSQGHGYSRTLVYGAQYGGAGPLPTFSNAVLVHEFVGQVGSFAAAPGAQWHVWFKWRSVDGVLSSSPAGGTNGHQATASKIGNIHLGPLIVEAGNLANGAVTASKLAAQAVTLTAFAAGIEPVAIVGALPNPVGYAGARTVLLTTDGKLYRYVSGAWTRAVDGADIVANSITAGSIAAGAIGATQIAAQAIRTSHLLVTGQGAALNSDPAAKDSSAWTNLSGTPVSFVTGVTDFPAGGSTAMQGASLVSSRPFSAELIPVDSQKNYRMEGWFKRISGTTNACFFAIAWYDAAGVFLTSSAAQPGGAGNPAGWTSNGTFSYAVLNGQTPATTWTRYVFSFGPDETAQIPSNARFMRIGGILNNTAQASAVQFSGVRLMEKAAADLIVDGSIIATKLAANAIAVGTAAIQNGAIVNAMIADATITNAKIVTLSASKIIAGSLAVGEYIQSSAFTPGGTGFRIDGGGGVEIRNAGGTRVFHLGASGAQPILRAPGLDILANGSASFSGAISASSISGSTISGGTITGSVLQTAAAGQRVVINESSSNEARFYGDRGDGTVELLASLGITAVGSDFVIGNFGSASSSRTAIMARANGASAIYGIAYSNFTSAIVGQSIATGGIGVHGTTNSGTGIGVQGTALGAGAKGISGTNLTGPGVYGSTNNGIGVHGVAAVSGDGVRGESASGYGGRFAGNATKPAMMLEPSINTAMPTSAEVGSVAMVRFPAIGGGGGNVRLCYVDQFGTWRYVSSDAAI